MVNSKGMVKEAKSINLSLHYLEQVIVSLREQAHTSGQKIGEQTSSGGRPRYVPYRNSVLTSMLRDSLGGNCRSCFLVTASIDKVHFEETIASCRFGQRCGEISVKVVANTEIGLSDQLRELSIRVRALERQLVSADEQRHALETLLHEERTLRKQQSELRVLNLQEKLACKNCVQQLLSSAKDSLSLVHDASVDQQRLIVDSVIERSQEALYCTVEDMDKAVLIELSTALGGLVQSMFLEREAAKLALINEEAEQRQQEANVVRLREIDELQCIVLKSSIPRELASLPHLPDSRMAMLRKGSIFVKHGWLGKKSVRLVMLTDVHTLSLQSIGGPSDKKRGTTFVSLSTLDRCDPSFIRLLVLISFVLSVLSF